MILGGLLSRAEVRGLPHLTPAAVAVAVLGVACGTGAGPPPIATVEPKPTVAPLATVVPSAAVAHHHSI